MDAPTSAGVPAAGLTTSLPPKRIPAALKDNSAHPDLRSRPQTIPISPSRHPYPAALAASPSRLRSSSPRLHSPASSEIFERNVQEPIPISTLGGELSPAHIPTHVITEDSIPPALEASAQAITSDSLNPDEVEIVTATSHQPAAASVLDSTSGSMLSELHSPLSALAPQRSADDPDPAASNTGFLAVDEDSASTYAQLDPNDVRRLSFISFKDIVQGEQQQQWAAAAASSHFEPGNRDSLHFGGGAHASVHDQISSPLRSPASTASQPLSAGLATPPSNILHPSTLNNPLLANATPGTAPTTSDLSPVRSLGLGSASASAAASGLPSQHGELTIETMRQALRKTASGDLAGVRSTGGMSPVSSSHASP